MRYHPAHDVAAGVTVPIEPGSVQARRITPPAPGVVTAACGASTDGTPKVFPGFVIIATKTARVEANGGVERHATAIIALSAT